MIHSDLGGERADQTVGKGAFLTFQTEILSKYFRLLRLPSHQTTPIHSPSNLSDRPGFGFAVFSPKAHNPIGILESSSQNFASPPVFWSDTSFPTNHVKTLGSITSRDGVEGLVLDPRIRRKASISQLSIGRSVREVLGSPGRRACWPNRRNYQGAMPNCWKKFSIFAKIPIAQLRNLSMMFGINPGAGAHSILALMVERGE
ncbi:hypothetical protein TNCV_3041451 [Trichonephila clavipes]|nr:hypothetical protein TNCV_3041451 [Trichonephila clavipes]